LQGLIVSAMTLQSELSNGVLSLRLNRPQRLNAIDAPTAAALLAQAVAKAMVALLPHSAGLARAKASVPAKPSE